MDVKTIAWRILRLVQNVIRAAGFDRLSPAFTVMFAAWGKAYILLGDTFRGGCPQTSLLKYSTA
jgi:hypothetical protein